jgi:hypothetical protein
LVELTSNRAVEDAAIEWVMELSLPETSSVRLLAAFLGDGYRNAAKEIDNLDAAIDSLTDETDHLVIFSVASAAIRGERVSSCRVPLTRLVSETRDTDAYMYASIAMLCLCYDAFLCGD